MKKIYWYAPEEIFSSFGKEIDNPSFRLRCWNIHKKLNQKGSFLSSVVHFAEPIMDSADSDSVLVLMSFGEKEYRLAHRVVERGGHVIHDYCENIGDIPILEETKKLCRYIVCSSTFLARIENQNNWLNSKIKVIKDSLEIFPYNVSHNYDIDNDKLKVVWCGMGGNAPIASDILKPIIEENGMEYVEISNRPESTIQWNFDTFRQEMARCDIAICPQDHWNFPAKSNVKVTTAMSLGLPVLASPLLSYEELIINGFNGYLCHNLEDWAFYLDTLKEKRIRRFIANNGYVAADYFSFENIFNQWEVLLRSCW